MRHCETLYINCESNHIPSLHNSEVIRFDNRNYHAYGTFTALLSHLFFKAYRIQDNGLLKQPYSASIILPKVEKFKPEDPEDNLTRIKYMLNNFVPPKYGIIISIYEAMEHIKCLTPNDFFVVWPYKKQWTGKGNYVVLQDIKPTEKNNNYDYDSITKSYNNILHELNNVGIEYKIIGYTTPIKEVFNLLRDSKLYITWCGGLNFLSGGLSVPTLVFGHNPAAQIDNYLDVKLLGNPFKNNVLKTMWGESLHHQERVIHFNEEKGIHQSEQKNTKNIGNVMSNEEIDILKKQLLERC